MKTRWRHIDGFGDNVDYLEWDGAQMWMILKDGTRETAATGYTVKKCRDYVASGIWIEWEG
jgi:hypothetical protein